MTGSAAFPRHGGDLAFASARYGMPPDGWLDLSTGINPVPYPAPPLASTALTQLPDAAGLAALLAAARRAYRIPDTVAVAATPGSEIALRLVPTLVSASHVAIASPTYGSHADAWRDAGHAVTPVASRDPIPAGAPFAVIGNPNNPDGRVAEASALAAIARTLGQRGGFLVVDEAFADVAPDVSLGPHLRDLPAVVFRSLGKFYGLPGLRLGFAAGAPAIVDRLAARLGAWPVSGPAIAIGTAALGDTGWQAATRERLAADAARLRAVLTRHDLAVAGGTDLFVLVESERAASLHAGLARRGIWTRAFPDMPARLRIGLPPPSGFVRLEAALADLG